MSGPSNEQQDSPSTGGESYSLGYGSASSAMAGRSAERQAAFFLPHLKPGMTLLDCGCGPGTISMGLAERDPTIKVTGIDLSEDQVKRATASSAQQGISNVRFEVGSVYELPFPDDSFDGVFNNALFEHLADPADALRDIRRVLKIGGVLGIRAAAHNLDLVHPPDPKLTKLFDVYTKVLAKNGGNPGVGARLGAMMRKARFSEVSMTASHDHYSAGSAAQVFAEQLANIPILGQAVDLGIITEDESQSISVAWRAWGAHRDAFLARTYGEAVGWKT